MSLLWFVSYTRMSQNQAKKCENKVKLLLLTSISDKEGSLRSLKISSFFLNDLRQFFFFFFTNNDDLISSDVPIM